MFNDFAQPTRHSYYDSNGNTSNLYKGFAQAVNKRFGTNGTHHHLREDEKMEKLVSATVRMYENNPHLDYMKDYFSYALGFIENSWIKPCSSRHEDFSPISL